jgi:hypothetical protein
MCTQPSPSVPSATWPTTPGTAAITLREAKVDLLGCAPGLIRHEDCCLRADAAGGGKGWRWQRSEQDQRHTAVSGRRGRPSGRSRRTDQRASRAVDGRSTGRCFACGLLVLMVLLVFYWAAAGVRAAEARPRKPLPSDPGGQVGKRVLIDRPSRRPKQANRGKRRVRSLGERRSTEEGSGQPLPTSFWPAPPGWAGLGQAGLAGPTTEAVARSAGRLPAHARSAAPPLPPDRPRPGGKGARCACAAPTGGCGTKSSWLRRCRSRPERAKTDRDDCALQRSILVPPTTTTDDDRSCRAQSSSRRTDLSAVLPIRQLNDWAADATVSWWRLLRGPIAHGRRRLVPSGLFSRPRLAHAARGCLAATAAAAGAAAASCGCGRARVKEVCYQSTTSDRTTWHGPRRHCCFIVAVVVACALARVRKGSRARPDRATASDADILPSPASHATSSRPGLARAGRGGM